MSATTTSPPQNLATVLNTPSQTPFSVEPRPYPTPHPNEVIIATAAVAINPVDTAMQDHAILIPHYPWTLGQDGSGTITALGSSITKSLRIGDRVLMLGDPLETQRSSNATFQQYVAVHEKNVAKIPEGVGFAEAAVLPLAMSTAAVSLCQRTGLGLPLPQCPRARDTGKVLLVWGGASSVGTCGIQIAKAAGFAVVATASARNASYCKEVGADVVVEYAKESVVADVVAGLKETGKEFAGAFDAILAPDTMVKCSQVIKAIDGSRVLATVLPPEGMPVPEGLAEGVRISKTWGSTLPYEYINEVVFGGWVTAALASGELKCKPDPLIVGRGVEMIQEGCKRCKEGVSARKVVVEL